jgi:hypothetical protein
MPTNISFTSVTLAAEITRLQSFTGYADNDVYIALVQLQTAFNAEVVAEANVESTTRASNDATAAWTAADTDSTVAAGAAATAATLLQEAVLAFATQLASEANTEESALALRISANSSAFNNLTTDITKFTITTPPANNFESDNAAAISTANDLSEGLAKTKAKATIDDSRKKKLADDASAWKNQKKTESDAANSLKSRATDLFNSCATTTVKALAAYNNARNGTLKA